MPLSRSTTQSPSGWDKQNLTRAGMVTRLQDQGWRYTIHPLETARGFVSANLTFGHDPGDIRRYGAVDGGAAGANTTAINNAITAWDSVFVPPGTFAINAPILLRGNVDFYGAAGATSVISTASALASMLSTTTGTFSNIRIANLLLNGGGVAAIGLNLVGVSQGAVSNIFVDRVQVANCTTKGMLLKQVTYGDLKDCSVSGNAGACVTGVHFQNSYNCTVFGRNVYYDSSDAQLLIQYCTDINVDDATFFNNPTVTSHCMARSQGSLYTKFRRCTFEAQGATVKVQQELDISTDTTGPIEIGTEVEQCDFIGVAAAKTYCIRLGTANVTDNAAIYQVLFRKNRHFKPAAGASVVNTTCVTYVFEECKDITSYGETDYVPVSVQNNTAAPTCFNNREFVGRSREFSRYTETNSTNFDVLQISMDYQPAGVGTATTAGFGGGIQFGLRTPGNVFKYDMARISCEASVIDNGSDLWFYTRPNAATVPQKRGRFTIGGLFEAIFGIQFGDTLPKILSGAGTPLAVVAAPVGSIFLRNDGGAATTLYVKESGTGTAGWVAK